MRSARPPGISQAASAPGGGMEAPRYTLPDLDYDFGALEPHISGRIMELHYGKHHAGYVSNTNRTVTLLEEARVTEDFTRLAALERALAFNLSGHVLHSILWKNMSPKGGGLPAGVLAGAIDRDFGSFEKFKRQLTEIASTIMGSGWAALIWEPIGEHLFATKIHDHQSSFSHGTVPLMVIDAWEHAYYLQYQNQKEAYLEAIWHLWNWKDVAERFAAARHLNLLLP